MKYIIFSDTHIGSKYNDDPTLLDQIDNSDPSNTILLGDIIDMACCHKKIVNDLRQYQLMLLNKFNDRYVSGNHCLLTSNLKYIENGILFTHGDLISNFDKWWLYRLKTAGAGKLKLLWVSLVDNMDWLKENMIPKESVFKRAADVAKNHDCHTIVMGHFHPSKVITRQFGDVKIIIVPKGLTELDL
ncbi:MAG TPA: metallophosphoesterase family protein [Allocoleopsis sp.]